jgi:hypothetical protein
MVLIVAIDSLKMICDVGVADMEGGLPIQVDNPPRSRVKGRKKEEAEERDECVAY